MFPHNLTEEGSNIWNWLLWVWICFNWKRYKHAELLIVILNIIYIKEDKMKLLPGSFNMVKMKMIETYWIFCVAFEYDLTEEDINIFNLAF